MVRGGGVAEDGSAQLQHTWGPKGLVVVVVVGGCAIVRQQRNMCLRIAVQWGDCREGEGVCCRGRRAGQGINPALAATTNSFLYIIYDQFCPMKHSEPRRQKGQGTREMEEGCGKRW